MHFVYDLPLNQVDFGHLWAWNPLNLAAAQSFALFGAFKSQKGEGLLVFAWFALCSVLDVGGYHYRCGL